MPQFDVPVGTCTQARVIYLPLLLFDPAHYSGMETMIRSQREAIAELEAKVQANMDEITKVDHIK